jgi:hypothetical protein
LVVSRINFKALKATSSTYDCRPVKQKMDVPARRFDCAADLRYKDQRSNGATIRVDHILSTCRGDAPGWREPVAIARPWASI